MSRSHISAAVVILISALVAPATFVGQAYADTGLVGYWSFDSGTIDWDTGVVSDESDSGNHGMVNNLTADAQVAGKVGSALQFDGTSAYVSVSADGAFPPSGNAPRTVCLWLKPTADSWTENVNTIFEYGEAGTRTAYAIDMHNFPQMQFYTWGDDLFVNMGIEGQETEWLQVCYVYNGATTLSLYSNGVLRGTHGLGGQLNTTANTVNIGRSAIVGSYFDGIVDEVRIYDRAFTGEEIEEQYEQAANPIQISNIASSTTQTTATVTWDTATSSDSSVWYGATSGTYTTSTSSATLVSNHSIGLVGLSQNTTYYFVVVSADNSGNAATSSEQTLRTLADTTAPAISSISASSLTATGATITWDTDEAASTKIVYSIDTTYASSTSETDTSPRVTSHSQALTDLLSCTIYSYKTVSRDAVGNAATSTADQFTTTGCTGGAAPTSATSTSISVSSAASTTVSDSGRTFLVETPEDFTATSSSIVIQIKGLSADTVLGSLGRPNSLSSAAEIVFDVKALIDNITELDSFDVPVTITYSYTDDDIDGLDESTLSMYHYANSAWTELDDCSVDAAANTITCTAPHFSIFAIFGSSLSSDSDSSNAGAGGALPWCSGPTAPGWNSSLPDGGCGAATLAAPVKQVTLSSCPAYTFTRTLRFGVTGEDVRALQRLMNCLGFKLAESGAGSPGEETNLFVERTYGAVIRFQEAYHEEILVPVSESKGTGIFATYSQKKAEELTQ